MDIRHLSVLSLLLASSGVFAAPPIANNDARTIPQNVPVTINVLSNDSDPDGDGISVIVDSVTQPQVGGTVTVNPDGGLYFVPTRDFVGNDIRFTYSIVDDSGQGEQSQPAVVIINVVAGKLAENMTTDYGVSVGTVLDQVCTSLAGTGSADSNAGTALLTANCEALLALEVTNPEAAAQAVQQISPEEALALAKLGTNASELQQDIVSNRISQLGGGGLASQGRIGWSKQPLGGAAGDDSVLAKIGLFASVQLEDADKEMSNAEAGFDYTANAFTAGADYALSSSWFIGSAFGWTGNELTYKNDAGSVDSDIYNLIAYSTYNLDNLTFDAQLGFGSSQIDLSRNIVYGLPGDLFSAQTQAETSGKEWFLTLQTQYMWNRAAWTVYPRAAITYSSSKVNGYAETQAGGWDVIMSDQTVERAAVEAGLQTTYAFSTNWGVLVPNLDFTLISDINTEQDLVTGQFAYAPTGSLSFSLGAEEPDSMYYQVGVGFSALFTGGVSVFTGLRQTLGYTDFNATQFEAGFRMEI